MRKRANFYIDGYNLYKAIKESKGQLYPQYLWLDLLKLCSFLKNNYPDSADREDLNCIKYFTALPIDDLRKADRHRTYLRALECSAPGIIHIYFGRFKHVTHTCPHCGPFWDWQEKGTDVALAVEVAKDFYANAYDNAYIVSADSDLIPAWNLVDSAFPQKHAKAWFPPERDITELRYRSTIFARTIKNDVIKECQFPDPVIDSSGQEIRKPAKWCAPKPQPASPK